MSLPWSIAYRQSAGVVRVSSGDGASGAEIEVVVTGTIVRGREWAGEGETPWSL